MIVRKWSIYIPSILFLIIIFLKLNSFNDQLNVITWDTLGYYLYLPSTFLYDDVVLNNYELYDSLIKQYNLSDTFYQVTKAETGNHIYKYSMGIGILLSPFYFIADLITKYSSYPRDGFSYYYQLFIYIGGYFYSIIGAMLLPKILSSFYKNSIVIITVFLFLFGTSYFYEAAHGNLMPHNIIFSLYAILIYFTIKFYESKRVFFSVLISLTLGLLVISRPTEGIAILIPFLWDVKSFDDLKNKFQKINFSNCIVFCLPAFFVVMPQIIYWKFVGGSWLITDYGNPAEGLDWFSPHILDVLFSFRKGWFIYTPLSFLCVLSFYFLSKERFSLIFSLSFFFVINLYVVSSWSCWWYASSFSMRALVQSSVILIFPLASFIKFSFSSNFWRRLLIIIPLLFVVLNQFQIWQMEAGIIHPDRMTFQYYKKIFLRTEVSVEDQNLLLIKRSTNANDPDVNFSDLKQSYIEKESFNDFENGAFQVDSLKSFSPAIRIPFNKITSDYYGWIHGEYWIFPTKDVKEHPFSIVYSFEYKRKLYKYRAIDSENLDLKINEWNKLEFKYLTPEVRTEHDNFVTYVWNRSSQVLFIDSLSINCYQKY